MKKKVAIIGGGQIAETVHVPFYRNRIETEIVAVVDRNAKKASDFAKRNNIPSYYTDTKEMLEKERPDIVSICTPNRFHYEYTLLSLNYGCDVICEKPPAITASEAYEMYKLAEEKHCILAYNFHHRFAEDVKILKQQFSDGVLGDVYVIKVKALRRSGVPGWGSFTNKTIQGGGPLIDIGVHMLDAALYILDYPKVKKVTAKMYKKIANQKSSGTLGKWDPDKYEVEDSLFGFIELENGGLIQLETSFALNMKESSIMNVEFFGDRAGATLFPAQVYTDKDGELVSLLFKESSNENRHFKSMEAFVDKCLGKEVMIADGYQGYLIQKVVESLYQSAEKGEAINL